MRGHRTCRLLHHKTWEAWRAERQEPLALLGAGGQGLPLTLCEVAEARHRILTDRRRLRTTATLQGRHILRTFPDGRWGFTPKK